MLTAQGVLSLTTVMTLFVAVMKWSDYGKRIERAMAATTTAIDPERVLIIRSPADEASGRLITGQFASQITVRVYLAALQMYDRIGWRHP
jgi:hypothetical protein